MSNPSFLISITVDLFETTLSYAQTTSLYDFHGDFVTKEERGKNAAHPETTNVVMKTISSDLCLSILSSYGDLDQSLVRVRVTPVRIATPTSVTIAIITYRVAEIQFEIPETLSAVSRARS